MGSKELQQQNVCVCVCVCVWGGGGINCCRQASQLVRFLMLRRPKINVGFVD